MATGTKALGGVQPITRIPNQVSLFRDSAVSGDWLIRVPHTVMYALNKTINSGGTFFTHGGAATIWTVDGGTELTNGTAIGIFIGTGGNT